MKNASRIEPPETGSSAVAELRSRTNLTQNQLGFWLGQRVAPNSTMFNMGQLYRFDFDVEPNHFRTAITKLIEHSDALRTQFREVEGVPEQIVADDIHFDLPVMDLSGENDADRELAEWCADRISLPFDLKERCFDFALLKLAEGSWAWYLCIHHIVIDGTSVDLIFRYVEELYQLSLDGGLHEAVAPPQFSTYIEKETIYRASRACHTDEKFWSERPAIDSASTTFYGYQRKTDANLCVRESVKLGSGHTKRLLDTVTRILGAGTSADLDLLTAYLALLAAYQFKVGGGDTLTVGAPFHNRATQTEKRLVGLVMEVVPLQIELCAEDTFSTLLIKARAEILAVLRHYRYGGTNAAREKSYDIMLNLVPSTTNEFAGGQVRTEWLHSGEWNEAMTLQVQHTRDGSTLYFDLNQELFPHGLTTRAPEHFLTLSEELVAEPDRVLDRVRLVPDSERGLIERSLHCAAHAHVANETIVSRFEDVVERLGDSVAVIGTSGGTTYRDLNDNSNRIARQLLALGVSGNEHIGICLPRTVDRIAGILAILKAGGAYVPVDESWPSERTDMTMQDAGVGLIVTNSDNAEMLNLSSDVQMLIIDQSVEELNHHSNENLAHRSKSTDVAYINFTSGSTGRPKGVLVPHAGVVRLVAEPKFTEWNTKTVMMHLSSISFDASTFEIWSVLLNGGRLVLPSHSLPSGDAIRKDIQRYSVNRLFVTTSLFNALVDDDPRIFAGVEDMFTGGEAASPSHFAKCSEALPDTRLLNLYGPTECTVMISFYVFTGREQPGSPIPIGKPIPDTFVRVLDDRQQDVPIGAVGELHAGGSGLAQAYVSQPELTKSRFIQLDDQPGERLYKTGDFVRIAEDGNLVFVGRRDNQVKVRGFLIELDEVESALNSISDVGRAVISMCQAADQSNGLAAYVVPALEGLTAGDVRESLRATLPDKMMPRWYVFLDELPLGSTGKVDRSKLPHPEAIGVELERNEVPQFTAAEARVAEIWRDLLRLDVIGPNDNFFELGGDSIVAIQLAARGSKIGLGFDAQDVFENPTIRSLAEAINSSDVDVAEWTAIHGDVALSPAQCWFFEHDFPEPDHWNMAVALRTETAVNVDAMRGAIVAVVGRHDALRARFEETESGWSQYIDLPAKSCPLEHVRIKDISGEELDKLVQETKLAAQRSLDIRKGELVRVVLFDAEGDGTSHLLWIVHHLSMDGVSWRVLLHDFDLAYRQIDNGGSVELPVRSSSIRDFADARMEYAGSSAAAEDRNYWSAESDWDNSRLPADFISGRNLTGTERCEWVSLSTDETHQLAVNVPQVLKIPVNHVLVTALVNVLCEWSGHHSIAINMEGHGRERLVKGIDLGHTIGWFTTIFPVLLTRRTNCSALDGLKALSKDLERVPRKGVGYGIDRYLAERTCDATVRRARAPVSFNYLGQFDQLLAHDSDFAIADLFSGKDALVQNSISPANQRAHQFDVVAQIDNDRLHIGWFFSADMYSTATIAGLMERYCEELRIIVSSTKAENEMLTGAERFADSGLSSDELSSVLSELGFGGSPT